MVGDPARKFKDKLVVQLLFTALPRFAGAKNEYSRGLLCVYLRDLRAIFLIEVVKPELSDVDLPVYSNLPTWSKENRVPASPSGSGGHNHFSRSTL